ncbi:MAG: hypothetical protein JSU72_06790 [Deltaproteobacteria bacterium]|nr:MAG: hypothetical protein JSU72_06790 [Deltaproteobacteria bacterium]
MSRLVGVFAQWLLVASVLISGCVHPVSSRLVTVELVKGPDVDVKKVETIGILPFASPEYVRGDRLAEEMKNALNREPFVARIVPVEDDRHPDLESRREMGKRAQVEALLSGEITEYYVQTSKETVRMVKLQEIDTDNPTGVSWVAVEENPAVADVFYYRLLPLEESKLVPVHVSRTDYALTVYLHLVSVESGASLWEGEIGRQLERVRLAGSPMETDAEVREMQASIVREVVSRLRPQESTVQRMVRAPRARIDEGAATLWRQAMHAIARDDWSQAERLFLEAAELAPKECAIDGNLGVVYEKSGRLLEAVAAYERAYRCQPRDPTYRYYRDDLQFAFAPNLDKKDLPTLVLGVREDGIIYLDGGKERRQHRGDSFIIYRIQEHRDETTARSTNIQEIEFARGEIIKVQQQMSLGRLLLFDPERAVKRGDLVRFVKR